MRIFYTTNRMIFCAVCESQMFRVSREEYTGEAQNDIYFCPSDKCTQGNVRIMVKPLEAESL